MPARTLPSSPEPTLSPLRFHPRPSPHALPPPSGRTRTDSYANDDRRPRPEQPSYTLAMPAQLARIDTALSAAPTLAQAFADLPPSNPGWSAPTHRVYPDPATIPPHWQVHPGLRDARPQVPPGTVWARPYNAGVYNRVLPVQTFVAPPPPPIPHKVWILDCKSCGMFLTNRGMKAVLLLRPNVPLYSTDALPINCSAFSAPADSSSTPPRSSSSSSPAEPAASSADRPLSRTCECLTQTLCCHGCGNAVGYMIVAPCTRCTSSITANNRATNGHRFVFYSSEIVACKRHYVAGEPGVTAFHPPPTTTAATMQSVQNTMAQLQIAASPSTPPRPSQGQQQQSGYSPTSPASPSMPSLISSPVTARTARRTSVDQLPPVNTSSDAVPSSPSSPGYLSPSALAARSRASSSSVHTEPPTLDAGLANGTPPVPPNSHATSPSAGGTSTFAEPRPRGTPPSSTSASIARANARARAASTSAALTASPNPSAHGVQAQTALAAHPFGFQVYQPRAAPAPQPEPEREPLKAGEVLYWHHLSRSGEIPAVFEDVRARMDVDAQAAAEKEKEVEEAKRTEAAARRRASVGVGARRIIAGR